MCSMNKEQHKRDCSEFYDMGYAQRDFEALKEFNDVLLKAQKAAIDAVRVKRVNEDENYGASQEWVTASAVGWNEAVQEAENKEKKLFKARKTPTNFRKDLERELKKPSFRKAFLREYKKLEKAHSKELSTRA